MTEGKKHRRTECDGYLGRKAPPLGTAAATTEAEDS